MTKRAPDMDKKHFTGEIPIEENGIEEKTILEDYEHLRITKEKNIPRPEPVITIAGARVAIAGNITAISAESKAGKTAVAGVILAGAISKTGIIDGLSDLEVKPNINCFAVIHLDTEQSEPDQQDAIIAALKRAGIDETPNYFYSYNIRKELIENYETLTNNICSQANEKHGGIHLILIDGGADFLYDVNDQELSNKKIQYFIHLSIKYNCPVVIIVHVNPGSDKERGHFGSIIQRRCYGLLSVKKTGDVSTLEAKIMRKAANDDIPPISFKYSKEKGYHVRVDTVSPNNEKAIKERNRLQKIAEKVFAPPASLRHKDAVSKIMNETNMGKSTAKTMLENMEGFQQIVKGEDGFYRFNMYKEG